jgi:hypothetical protein
MKARIITTVGSLMALGATVAAMGAPIKWY